MLQNLTPRQTIALWLILMTVLAVEIAAVTIMLGYAFWGHA